MGSARAELLAGMMEAATNATIKVAEGIPEDKRTVQIRDGKSHPLWLLGHIANTTSGAVIGLVLGQKPVCPKEYRPLFAPAILGGEAIRSDAAHYPSWDEVMENYTKTATAAIEGIRGLSDEDLAGPAKGPVPDRLKDMFAVTEKAIISFVIHDAHHKGQMATLDS